MVNTAQAITELGVGEALVSFLDEGPAHVVERGYVLTPASQIGPISGGTTRPDRLFAGGRRLRTGRRPRIGL
jgi:hypothetical protein